MNESRFIGAGALAEIFAGLSFDLAKMRAFTANAAFRPPIVFK